MTVEDIKEAIENDKEGSSSSTKLTYANKILKAVSTSCKSRGETPEAAQYARQKYFALQDYFGMHSLFFMISPDDEYSFE